MKLISACIVFLHAMVANAMPQPQGGGGNLGVECKTQKGPDGNYKVNCEGVNQDAIALRSEHILWLQGPGGESSVVDIEIPNYKIAELIKAGFKQSEGQGPKINVLLKKPEQTYEAQVDELKPSSGEPSVSLQYEPVDKTVVHFPNDKAYSPLSGPILPPPNGGNARPQRHSAFQGSPQAKSRAQARPQPPQLE
ncbi:hypothetical protein Ocin01_10791 [Orchesella cincta]|uniref:Uncharacterized protein n=1 Tax=Orchesella cincta TaxID=48709 RepID=A0A1D2MS87_ORCCI|nr:hypothetical protein Ocin01_10791 [Orchesella cincta]